MVTKTKAKKPAKKTAKTIRRRNKETFKLVERPAVPMPHKPLIATSLILRTCNADLSSSHGFRWPALGPVSCKDWQPTPECGHGLHGLLWGEGRGDLLNWQEDAKWQVVEVESSMIVDLVGKVKYPSGNVLYTGDRKGATDFIAANGGAGKAIVGATVTGGVGATVTGGYGATVTGGYRATVTGGYRATVTGGDGATVTGGYRATVTGGDGATVTGGDRATVMIRYYDAATGRYRIAIAYVGENGIKAQTKYRLDDAYKFTEAK